MKCPNCTYENTNLTSLSVHYRKTHNQTAEQLYVELFHGGQPPTCKCGCGEKTKFLSIIEGYRFFKRGHAARVHNNWGHNEKALENSQNKRREMFVKGELVVWNKGLSGELDERVEYNNKAVSSSILANKEELLRRSNKMKEQWSEGALKVLYGPAHSQWKGGYSKLCAYIHGNSLLYKGWKRPKLQAANFTCQRCGITSAQGAVLHVHHDKERMAEITQKILLEHPGDPDDEQYKSEIATKVAIYHIENDVSGEIICELCHKKEHPSLNLLV